MSLSDVVVGILPTFPNTCWFSQCISNLPYRFQKAGAISKHVNERKYEFVSLYLTKSLAHESFFHALGNPNYIFVSAIYNDILTVPKCADPASVTTAVNPLPFNKFSMARFQASVPDFIFLHTNDQQIQQELDLVTSIMLPL